MPTLLNLQSFYRTIPRRFYSFSESRAPSEETTMVCAPLLAKAAESVR
jgi:hypothetical protein